MDISVLDGLGENLYGRDEILALRKARPVTEVEPRRLLRTLDK